MIVRDHEDAPGHLLSRSLSNAIELARNRIIIGIMCFLFVLGAIGVRLATVMVLNPVGEPLSAELGTQSGSHLGRANIIDRNGEILATSITTSSLYANAEKVINPQEAAEKIVTVLPKLNKEKLVEKLQSGKRFIWLVRHLTPAQQKQILHLGIPGVSFIRDQRRIYPYGSLVSHVVGLTDIDTNGIGGIEKSKDEFLRCGSDALQISLDIKLQHIVYKTLKDGMEEFAATGAAGILMDLETEEVLAMVSLPDFNPNKPVDINSKEFFNKATLGMYEMGSTFKIANTAMVLESGVARLDTVYDTSSPIHIGRFTITDYRANHGFINVAQIFVYSSNKGSIRMAMAAGTERQQKFLAKLGFLTSNDIELPEHGKPIIPKHWREANTMTIAYGYGISVSPLHLLNGVASIIGDGCRKQATLLKKSSKEQTSKRERIVSSETSRTMLQLMRYVVLSGTSTKANVKGYFIAGKTGTRNLLVNGHYSKERVSTTFVGVLGENQDKPKYIVVILLEDPKRSKKTYGFNTAGWNAAPIGGRILARVAAMKGIQPTLEPDRVTDPFFKSVTFKGH
jgi:cell division protein FtsI (penicillin-binding protein 3)